MGKRRLLFVLYSLALLDIVVFKFYGDVASITSMMDEIELDRQFGCWNANLIPLNTISAEWENEEYLILGANVLLFTPLGWLLPYVFEQLYNTRRFLSCAVICVLACEAVQFLLKLGFFDVDDILLNTAGACLGYAVYRWWLHYCEKQANKSRM